VDRAGLKKTHYKLRFTSCATSKGLELINTFRRDLATGLNKEIPMLPQGSVHIQHNSARLAAAAPGGVID
jgi:hypothetical protein